MIAKMSTTDTISPALTDSVLNCLGERFQHGHIKVVRMEAKGDKLESKILALSKYRAFILSFKVPTKLEHEFHFLEIHQLESLKPLRLKIQVAIKKDSLPKTIYHLSTNSTEEVDTIIEIISLEIKKCFPNVFPIESIIPRIITKPENRRTSLYMKLEETFPDPGPCGGFTQMYACMCDLHQEPYMPEVAWDVDTIYLSQDSKELCLNDFDHLSHRDLVPIISALIHNNWFTKLSFRNSSRLSQSLEGHSVEDLTIENGDGAREINKVLQKSAYLEQLILENVGLKWSFTQDMCTAVMSNQNTVLRHINLSNNSLDDRGIRYLSSLLTRLPNGLVELNLAKTGLTAEGTLHLGKALAQNNFMSTSLTKLDVSGNVFKDGDISNLTGFLAQRNALTHLNMADTECALDNMFVALFRGCCANLSHLNLAGNTFTYRRGKDVPIQVSFKQFFATSTQLKYLNLSKNKLPPEVVKEVLLGIGGNDNLRDVELDLSSNELKTEGAQVVAGSIAHVNNITKLNLSDNDMNVAMGHLVDWIGHNKNLQSLDISKNMGSLKYKQLLKVLETIVQFIQNEELSLHTLSLADNKMKFETIQVINALGSNTTLTSIDISGNGMGDIGARMLAKALQLNSKLHTVKLDCNSITVIGFSDLANALEKNYTLKYMPTPVNDITAALKSHPEKASASLQKIQNLLQRNHSQHKFHDEQAFRLQQGFLYTTSHQMVDKLVVQTQDAIKGLIDCRDDDAQAEINMAQDYVLDADNSKLLLAALHQVALNVENDDLKDKLADMAGQLRSIVETQLQGSASGMIDTATTQCSNVMLDRALKESLENMCGEQIKMPPRFLQDVMEQVGAAISNRIGEAHLAMASHISDTIIDEIMEHLTESHQKLTEQLTDYRERKGSILTNGLEIESNDKDEAQRDKEKKESDEKKEDGETKEEDQGAKSPDAASPSSHLSNQRLSRYLKREVGRSDSVRFKDTEAGQQRRIGKVRPRSIIMKDFELTVAEVDTDSGDKLENDITDGAGISKLTSIPSKPKSPITKSSHRPKQLAKKAAADTKALDELTLSTDTLHDVRKDRVRPPRLRPTRPVNQVPKSTPRAENESGAAPVDAGVSAFYSSTFTELGPAKAVHPAVPLQIPISTASPELKKKKKLFQKKTKDEEKPKKEETTKKKFGLNRIFKKKHSVPHIEESDQPAKADTRRGSQPLGVKSPEKPTVTNEVPKAPQEEPSPKVAEKKAMPLPSIKRSVKAIVSPSKEPEPAVKLPIAEPKDEECKASESKEEAEIEAADNDAGSLDELTAKEEGDTASLDRKDDAPQLEEKEQEAKEEAKVEAKEEPKKEEEEEKEEVEKKPVPEMRKPGLAGAQMLGGTNLLQEMKLKREKRDADRSSREILEEQSPNVEEDKVKETTDITPAPPSSPDKYVPNLKLLLPKLPSPGPTSPNGGIKSPTSQSKISPLKPIMSPRVKAPMESPRKSPVEKALSNPSPSKTNEAVVQRQTSKEDAAINLEQHKSTEGSENQKIEKEIPVFKQRPLSGAMDPVSPKRSPTTPTTPEISWKLDTSVKPSDILKRNSAEVKARIEVHPVCPEKKSNGTAVLKPSSRPGSITEDKQMDLLAGKPTVASLSPKPKPRPAKRPISGVPAVAKKPGMPESRKTTTPVFHVTPFSSRLDAKPLETTPEKIPQKASSHKDTATKFPPVASKPRSRSLDPTMTTKVEPKPSTEMKDDILLEVPRYDGKRDSILSKSSDEGGMEDPDEYSTL